MDDLLESILGSIEWKQSTSERLVVIYEANQESLKLLLVTVRSKRRGPVLQMVSEQTHDCELCQWMEEPWAVTK